VQKNGKINDTQPDPMLPPCKKTAKSTILSLTLCFSPFSASVIARGIAGLFVERVTADRHGFLQASRPPVAFVRPRIMGSAGGRIVPSRTLRLLHQGQRIFPHAVTSCALDGVRPLFVPSRQPVERAELPSFQDDWFEQLGQAMGPVANHRHDAAHAFRALRGGFEDEAGRDRFDFKYLRRVSRNCNGNLGRWIRRAGISQRGRLPRDHGEGEQGKRGPNRK